MSKLPHPLGERRARRCGFERGLLEPQLHHVGVRGKHGLEQGARAAGQGGSVGIWLVGWFIGWLGGYVAGWRLGWLVGWWLVGRSVG